MAGGLTEEEAQTQADLISGDNGPTELRLHKDLQPLIELVEACQTNWNVAVGMGGLVRLGFDYPAFDVKARWMGIKVDRGLVSDLAVIENEALKLVNSQ